MTGAPQVPLAEVEAATRRALSSGDDSALAVLGYGEISLVVGWPPGAPTAAAKRLPEFPTVEAAEAYGALVERYLSTLTERGVDPLPSSFGTTPGPTGGVVGYLVQPTVPAATVGPEVLRRAVPDPDHPLLVAVCRLVDQVVDERTGLDGQLSNWALTGGGPAELRYLDVSTPMLFSAEGLPELDLDLFLAAYPWAVRSAIRRFVAPGVIGAYRDPRHVLVDLIANLVKERLADWVPAAVVAANRVGVPGPPVTGEEVRAYYRRDARLWEVMLRLRRVDRWWQRHVRRRTYPFLLPGPIAR